MMRFGLKKPKPKKQDYVAGKETAIVPEKRTDDWHYFFTKNRKQYANGYDTMSCVSFSAIASVEAQVNYIILKRKDIKDKLQKYGFLNDEGKCELNVWFTAVMSGTTVNGNTFQAVWDSIRKDGVLPNQYGKQPEDFYDIEGWLDKNNITDRQKEIAKKFLEIFDVKYQWVLLGENNPKKLRNATQYAPVQVQVKPCSTGWTGYQCIESDCITFFRHAVVTQDTGEHSCVGKEARFKIKDTYPKNDKLTDEIILFAILGYVQPKEKQAVEVKPKKKLTKAVWYGQRSEEVRVLQEVLKKEVPEAFRVEPTGYYGWWTRQGVIAFQEKYGLASKFVIRYIIRGYYVGPKTRKKINELIEQYGQN